MTREDDEIRARIVTLSTIVEAMEIGKLNEVQTIPQEEICSLCEVSGHPTKKCSTIPAFKEVLHDHANAANNFSKPYNNP